MSTNGHVLVPTEVSVHQPVVEDRDPPTRRKLFFFDRLKVLVLLAVFVFLTTSQQKTDIPLMSWGEAFRDQLRAKWWVLILAGLEVLRQIHNLISEHSRGYHQFWQKKVFGGWENMMSKMNPFQRFRLSKLVKRLVFLAVIGTIFSWMWGLSMWQALAEAPARIFRNIFINPALGLPVGLTIALSTLGGLVYIVFFFGIFFIGGVETFKPGEIKTRFADIWGQDHVVRRVKENLDFLEKPKEIEDRGGYVPGGILLWGPPGTGKTLLAEASAGETGKPYVFVDPSAFVQTFIGVAPMKIKHLYRRLRKLALRYGGVVVFFDEADVLGSRGGVGGGGFDDKASMEQYEAVKWFSPQGQRELVSWMQKQDAENEASAPERPRTWRDGIIMGGMMGGGGGMGTLQALLTEMNGLNKPRGFFSRRLRSFMNINAKKPPRYRILHMFATNLPNALDAALLRPGRIDRMYKVGYPMKDGRARTFQGYFDKIRHTVTQPEIERLSTMVPGATGASIKDLVNEAVLVALREGRDVVTWADVLQARYLRRVGEHEQVEFVERERHAIAIHEACHAVTAYLKRRHYEIDFVSIEPGAGYYGVVMSNKSDDTFVSWRSMFETDIMVALASLAGERMFFDGDSSAGVSGDLRSATYFASVMESSYGMGDTISVPSVVQEIAGGGGGGYPKAADKDDSDARHRASMGNRIEMHLARLLDETTRLLQENRLMVLAIAHALETHKTISGEDVAAIFDGRQGPKVNGRDYHHPSFLEVADRYHNEALVAHRVTGPVEIPLPVVARGNPQLVASSAPLPPPPPAPGMRR